MNVYDKYRVDTNMVEHGCCHSAAVVFDVPKGEGMYGRDVMILCETASIEGAELIAHALNNIGR